jgi:hypothetical protein
MQKDDILRVAREMIADYGDEALLETNERSHLFLALSDLEAARRWRDIGFAIQAMTKRSPITAIARYPTLIDAVGDRAPYRVSQTSRRKRPSSL